MDCIHTYIHYIYTYILIYLQITFQNKFSVSLYVSNSRSVGTSRHVSFNDHNILPYCAYEKGRSECHILYCRANSIVIVTARRRHTSCELNFHICTFCSLRVRMDINQLLMSLELSERTHCERFGEVDTWNGLIGHPFTALSVEQSEETDSRSDSQESKSSLLLWQNMVIGSYPEADQCRHRPNTGHSFQISFNIVLLTGKAVCIWFSYFLI